MRIKQLLAGPSYPDDAERDALARIFNIVSLAVFLALGVATFTNLFFSQVSFPVVLPVFFACVGALIAAARLGHLGVASRLLPMVILAGSAYLLLTRDGVHDTSVLAIAGTLIIGGILLTRRVLVIFTMASLAVILSTGYAEISGLLVQDGCSAPVRSHHPDLPVAKVGANEGKPRPVRRPGR